MGIRHVSHAVTTATRMSVRTCTRTVKACCNNTIWKTILPLATISVLCYFMGVKMSLWCNPQRIFYRGRIWYFHETFSKITSQLSSLLSLISLFTCFLSCLSLTTKLAFFFFGFLSSTKMAFRKSLTWVPNFLVILLLATIPFLQSSRTRELVSSLSLSWSCFLLFVNAYIYHSMYRFPRWNNNARKHSQTDGTGMHIFWSYIKSMSKIPFLQSERYHFCFFSFTVLFFQCVPFTWNGLSLKKVLFILFGKRDFKSRLRYLEMEELLFST